MHNIWKIFTTDIRRISNNVVAVVIIGGIRASSGDHCMPGSTFSPTGILTSPAATSFS
ncbi:MAG: hypothetical protein ACLVGL_12260 [Waltera sp.]